MHLEITKAGLQTTVQDYGRHGWMHMGFSRAGAMDPLAMRMANQLVAQTEFNPVLEFTLIGPDIVFHGDFQIAITGAQCDYHLNDCPVAMYKTINIKSGDHLTFQAMSTGCRGYIAFRQTMQIEPYLGSRATHLAAAIGGLNGRMLDIADKITFIAQEFIRPRMIKANKQPQYHGNYRLRISYTPETALFAQNDRHVFTETTFKVSKALNRMGVRMDNEVKLSSNIAEMSSRGLLPGAIQLPPNGKPIIAGQDAQTTGGYPRIGQIINTDLPIIGQLCSGDTVQFQFVTLSKARKLYIAQQAQLNEIYSG